MAAATVVTDADGTNDQTRRNQDAATAGPLRRSHDSNAESRTARRSNRLSAKTDQQMFAERERTPYGAGLSMGAKGTDGSEDEVGPNSGDQEAEEGIAGAGAGASGGSA